MWGVRVRRAKPSGGYRAGLRTARESSGFTLVEALVATVLVSIGLLGVLQLILASLREGAEALTRTQAVTLIGDIAERIRANPGGLDAYDIANYGGEPTEHGCAGAGARACSTRELAEDDLARWREQAFEVLPHAEAATVSFSLMPDGRLAHYLIELSWLQRGESQPTTLSTQLQMAGAPT